MNFKKPVIKPEELKVIISDYFDLDSYKIQKLYGIPNNTYRVISDGIDVVFKIYSIGQSSYSHIELEIKIILQMSELGLNTMELIKTKNGSFLSKFKMYYVCCSKFIDGVTLDSMPLSNIHYNGIGKLLGDFIKKSKYIDLSELSLADNLVNRLEYVFENFDDVLESKDLSNLKEEICTMNELAQEDLVYLMNRYPNALLHLDIWQYNIILRKDKYYLIDFDDWIVGPDIFEVAVTVLELSCLDGHYDSNKATQILKGLFDSNNLMMFDFGDLVVSMMILCVIWFGYNLIQSEESEDALIYLLRYNNLRELRNRNIETKKHNDERE